MQFRIKLIIISFLTLSACTISEEEQSYIHHIKQLEHSLDSAAKIYFEIDSNKLFKVYKHINSNLARYNDLDTVVNENINAYAANQKSIKNLISEHSIILDEINYSRNQLQTLKKDIRNKRITAEQMENYYLDEKEAVGVLIHKISFNTQNISQQLISFSQLNDSVEMIIKRLEDNKK